MYWHCINILILLQTKGENNDRMATGGEEELGICVGQIRWRLSMVAIKAQVNCLLSKLHQVGPGSKQLAQKRVWALKEDQRMSRE